MVDLRKHTFRLWTIKKVSLASYVWPCMVDFTWLLSWCLLVTFVLRRELGSSFRCSGVSPDNKHLQELILNAPFEYHKGSIFKSQLPVNANWTAQRNRSNAILWKLYRQCFNNLLWVTVYRLVKVKLVSFVLFFIKSDPVRIQVTATEGSLQKSIYFEIPICVLNRSTLRSNTCLSEPSASGTISHVWMNGAFLKRTVTQKLASWRCTKQQCEPCPRPEWNNLNKGMTECIRGLEKPRFQSLFKGYFRICKSELHWQLVPHFGALCHEGLWPCHPTSWKL